MWSRRRFLEAVSALRRATIVALDKSMALEAANVSLAPGLAMADAIVCATARRNAAALVTGDARSRRASRSDGHPMIGCR